MNPQAQPNFTVCQCAQIPCICWLVTKQPLNGPAVGLQWHTPGPSFSQAGYWLAGIPNPQHGQYNSHTTMGTSSAPMSMTFHPGQNPFVNLTPTIMANAPQQPSLPSSAPKRNAPATKTQPTASKRRKIAPALLPTPSSDENSLSHPTMFGVGPCGHAAPSSCEPLTGDHAGGAESVKPSNP